MIELDKMDCQILTILQEDAKLTTKEIAAALGLSTTPTYERIKRLERKGYIQGYVALVDRMKIGQRLVAFCSVSLKEHTKEYLEEFEREISKFEEVAECYHIAGKFDYLLKIVAEDMKAYHDFTFDKLSTIPNIRIVQSDFVMNDIKKTTAYLVKHK